MCLRETSSGDSDDSCNHAKLYQQFILRTIMTRIVITTTLVTMVCYVMTMYRITPQRGHVILIAAPVFHLPLFIDPSIFPSMIMVNLGQTCLFVDMNKPSKPVSSYNLQ